jgi:hypothetical protein
MIIGEIWENASGCTWRIDQLMKRKIWKLKFGIFSTLLQGLELKLI